MSFRIETSDRSAMLQVVQSCIGTKYTSRFGTLMAVSRDSHTGRLHIGHVVRKPSEICYYGIAGVRPTAGGGCGCAA
jgi:hypothetical protein